jgi:hypothetical protein
LRRSFSPEAHFFSKAASAALRPSGSLSAASMRATSARYFSRSAFLAAEALASADFGVSSPILVLRLVDRLGGGADHLDAELLQHAHPLEREGAVQRGLAAHGRQEGVGPLLLDDAGDDLRGDRLDVGRVGEIRIGHDRGRIRVDQDDPVPFLAQGLAGLRAGIVELACLADDDRARADDEDGGEIGALGHRTLQTRAARCLVPEARPRGA